jgi:hypothetical protein
MDGVSPVTCQRKTPRIMFCPHGFQEPHNKIAGRALAHEAAFADLFRLSVYFELGHSNGPALAAALRRTIVGKALAKNGKRVLNDSPMPSSVPESPGRSLQSSFCILEAKDIDNVKASLGSWR